MSDRALVACMVLAMVSPCILGACLAALLEASYIRTRENGKRRL